MPSRGQATVETLLVIGSAIFLVFLAYTALRSQVVAPGLSNVQQESSNASSAVASISPSARAGNVSAPPGVFIPNPCANCTANTSCPAGQDLLSPCTQECVNDACVPCNARCGFGCRTLSAAGYYSLSEDLSSAGSCFTIAANNVWLDCKGHAVEGTGSGTAVDMVASGVNNASVRNCRLLGYEAAVNFSRSNNAILQGNTLSASQYGVYGVNDNNLKVFNNTFLSASTAVFLSSSNNANITANNVSSAAYCGLQLVSSTSFRIASNNVSNSGTALCLESSSSGTISGNTLALSAASGINLSSSSSNVISSNNVTQPGSSGISITGSSSNVLSSNSIHSPGAAGVSIASSTSTTLTSNYVYTPASHGFLLSSATSASLVSNRVYSPSGSGIALSASKSVSASLNLVSSPSAYGFLVENATNSSAFSSNTVTGGVCAFYDCVQGACTASCPSASGSCKSNSFSSNFPNTCTSSSAK